MSVEPAGPKPALGLTGFEQFALRVVCNSLPQGSVVSTVYDGFVARTALTEEQLRDLEERVTLVSRRELTIALHVKISAKPFQDAAYHGFTPECESTSP